MRVQTLSQPALESAARQLYELGCAPAVPTLLVGIRTGGYVVAELMSRANDNAPLLPITCQRPSTKKKQKSSTLKRVLATLPYVLGDVLRIAEHVVLNHLRSPRLPKVHFDEAELKAITQFVEAHRNAYLLVVDDAVDSGATLAAVMEVLRSAVPTATLRAAALTVTTRAPMIEPEFHLYRYVLCRFPWSLDFKR